MAWSWSSSNSARVTVFRSDVPTEKMSFDGINSANSIVGPGSTTYPLSPSDVVSNINVTLGNIAGYYFKVDGITRSLKQEGVES